jgi:hypothetical protein
MQLLSKAGSLWSSYGFEICLVLCVLVLVILGLYNKFTGQRGSYSTHGDPYFRALRPATKHPESQNFHFNTTSRQIKGGRESKGETECRRVLQQIFNRPFPNQRPNWLRNAVTGGRFNLELDCYNPELRLAVEYQGQQHYKYIPYFHRNRDHFMHQKYRDEIKRHLCRANGVTLIEVPYTVKIPHIHAYITRELGRLRRVY